MGVLEGATLTDAPVAAPITRLFEEFASKSPDAIIVTDVSAPDAPRPTLTARQLNEKSNKLARWLLKQISTAKCDNPDGDRMVALCVDKSLDFVVTIVAILKAGCGYLPLDPSYPKQRVAHILRDCKPLLLVKKNLTPALQDEPSAIDLDEVRGEIDACSADNIPDNDSFPSGGESVACILYTSGSTGVPKGVRIPNRVILNHLTWQWRALPLLDQEVVCCPAPVIFVDSLFDIFCGLLSGHRLVLLGKELTRDAAALVRVLEEEKIGRILLVPTLLRAVLLVCGAAGPKLSNLRTWVCSSEVLPPDLLLRFFDVFGDGNKVLCNSYTSTEVAGMTNIEIRTKAEAEKAIVDNKVVMGPPVMNTNVYILRESKELSSGSICSEGEVGEACFSGPNVALGYVGGVGADKFVPNIFSSLKEHKLLYRVGDFVKIVDDNIVYEGRRDAQVKVRGHRVDLSEVETALQDVADVSECRVLCHLPGDPRQSLVGFFTSNNSGVDESIVLTHLRERVTYYMVPQLMQVAAISLLTSGKTDRKKLLQLYEDRNKGAGVDASGCPPGMEGLAQELLTAVVGALGPAATKVISLTDSFFSIGGNSLNVALVVASLQDKGWTLGMAEFLRSATLLEFLVKTTAGAGSSSGAGGGTFTIHDVTEADREPFVRLCAENATKENLMTSMGVPKEETFELFDQMWPSAIKQDLSFYLRRADNGKLACVDLNFDFAEEPEVTNLSKKMQYLSDVLEQYEGEAKETLKCVPGDMMIAFYFGTSSDLTPAENAEALFVAEMENQRRAKLRNFKGVVHTNTSRATRTLCEDVMGYKVINSFTPMDHVAKDGTKPFKNLSYKTAVSALIF